MFNERLPVHIDPLRMAESRRLLQGRIALSEMARLTELLLDSSGDVAVDLEFGIDSEGKRYMRGHIECDVMLECQRCLEPMKFHIDDDFALGLVRSNAEAESLPKHYEPLLVDEQQLFLRDVLEDELLLALPIVAKHVEGECAVDVQQADSTAHSENERETGETEKANPFSQLAQLKTDRKL